MKKPDLRIERRSGWIGSTKAKLYLSGPAFAAGAAGAGRTIVRCGIRRRLPALSTSLRTARIGSRSTAGASLTAVVRRRRRHQFIPRQFAVAVFVETFECSTGICDFVSINDAVVIRVQRANDGRRRAMATALRRFPGLSALLSAALRGIVAAALTGRTLSTLLPAGLAALSAIRRRWRTAILTALWRRWHQFIPCQFAVAV